MNTFSYKVTNSGDVFIDKRMLFELITKVYPNGVQMYERGSNLIINLPIDKGLHCELIASMYIKTAMGSFFTHDRNEATNLRLKSWVYDNFHFYGKGARSDKAHQFANNFMKAMGMKVADNMIEEQEHGN